MLECPTANNTPVHKAKTRFTQKTYRRLETRLNEYDKNKKIIIKNLQATTEGVWLIALCLATECRS